MRAFGLAVCVCHRVYGLVWFGCVCVIVCMGGCGGGGCLHTHPWIRRRDTEGFCVLYVQPLRTSTMYSLLSLSHTHPFALSRFAFSYTVDVVECST